MLDPGSFEEMDKLVVHRCNDFGMEKQRTPGDGVVAGHGLVEGRQVFVNAGCGTSCHAGNNFTRSAAGDSPAESDLFIQQTKLKNTLREWMGEQPVTHSEAG